MLSPKRQKCDGWGCLELLQEMIRIPSVNPDQCINPETDKNCGEARMATYLQQKFRLAGADLVELEQLEEQWVHHAQHPTISRPNVYGVWRSKADGAKWIGIDVHIDTVSVTGMAPFPAFSACCTDDGRLHGRGSCDTKPTLACALSLLHDLQTQKKPLPVNLVIAGTVGEETSRLGANGFREWLLRKQAEGHLGVGDGAGGAVLDEMLVAEPTSLVPVVAHKGTVRLRFDLQGKAAHSSKPHLGKNALVAAAQLIVAVAEEGKRIVKSRKGRGTRRFKSGGASGSCGCASRANSSTDSGDGESGEEWGLLGPPTLTPTLGSGGHGINIVPDKACVSVDYRVVASEDPSEVEEGLKDLAHNCLDNSEDCASFQVTNLNQDGKAGNAAFVQDQAHPWVARLEEWSGQKPKVVTFGTNATAYDSTVRGACVVFGPGDIAQAHMADEYIEIEQLSKMKTLLGRWWGL